MEKAKETNKRLCPVGTKQAVELFLNDENKDKTLVLNQFILNSFLRCIEALHMKANIYLQYSAENSPFYLVTRNEL